MLKILGLSSDGLLGYEAPRSDGAFRIFFGPGGTLFGRRDLPVSPQGDTPVYAVYAISSPDTEDAL